MRIIEALADAFINTFGITQPAARARRQASWFILGMLTVVLAGLAALGTILFHFLRGR